MACLPTGLLRCSHEAAFASGCTLLALRLSGLLAGPPPLTFWPSPAWGISFALLCCGENASVSSWEADSLSAPMCFAFSPLYTLRSPSCPSIGYSSPLSSSLLAVFLEFLFSFHPSSSSHLPSLSQRLARGLSSCFPALSLPRSRLPRPRPGRKAITCCGNGWEGRMGVDIRHLRMCCQP